MIFKYDIYNLILNINLIILLLNNNILFDKI
jgi:hypothetical protein